MEFSIHSDDASIFEHLLRHLVDNYDILNFIARSELGSVNPQRESNQPYLLLLDAAESSSSSYNMNLIIEQHKTIEMQSCRIFQGFLVLISAYYVFNLKFPNCCKQVYKALVNIYDFPPKLKKLEQIL